jgi:predicted metalloprotease with PDZ domain
VIRLEQHSSNNDLRYYGFKFRVLQKENHHVINSVDADGPAFQAGIRDGDYLLEVNGETITGLNHSQSLKKVLANPKHVDLLVVTDLDSYIVHRQFLSQANNSNISEQG